MRLNSKIAKHINRKLNEEFPELAIYTAGLREDYVIVSPIFLKKETTERFPATHDFAEDLHTPEVTTAIGCTIRIEGSNIIVDTGIYDDTIAELMFMEDKINFETNDPIEGIVEIIQRKVVDQVFDINELRF